MPLLKDIATSGFAGTAPTPVERLAINKYLVQDDLFNLMPFVNIGMGGTVGNIMASIVTYDAPDEAEFRNIGEEYDISNNEPKTVNVTLRQLGGIFQTDRALERAFGSTPGAMSNWTEQQIIQKINAIKNGFAKYFVQGDSSTDAKQFDGVVKYFEKFPSQENKVPMQLDGGLSSTNALAVETFLNTAIARLRQAPTCVITTRLKGKPFLQSLEQHRNRGLKAITVNDRQYYTFMGVPIVALEDSYFPTAMTSLGTPFIFVYMAEIDGVRVAVPMNPGVGSQGAVLDIVRPRMGNTDAGQSVFVRNGGVEMMCAPIMEDPFVISACYITEGTYKPVTQVTVNGNATITTDGGSADYTVTLTPSDASVKEVDFELTNGTGSGTLSNVTALGCKVTAVTNGTVTLKATAKDGSGVAGTKEITISNQT